MKRLLLNELETKHLLEFGAVEIVRNGFDILVEKDDDFKGEEYRITVVNPYNRVLLTDRRYWNEKRKSIKRVKEVATRV